VRPKFAKVQSTPSVKNLGAVVPQLPLPSKPIQAARRTSRVPLKLQRAPRSAQKVPPGGVNGLPVEDELLDELELLELELLEDELPGSGAEGQAPVTGIPSQVALPVVQSSVQSCSTASTRKEELGLRSTRLIWLLAGDVRLTSCNRQKP